MNHKFWLLPVAFAFALTACGGGDEPAGPAPIPVDPNAGGQPVVTPDPNQGGNQNPTPQTPTGSSNGAYAALPTGANAALAVNWYNYWKGTYFVTYETEAAMYPVLASDFGVVFGSYTAAGQFPGRIRFDTQKDAYCVIEEAAGTSLKARGCTVSEAVGYGMLLSFFGGDMDTFNRLWVYNKGYRAYAGSNLMPWKNGTFSYESVMGANTASATDADLDIATALILAYYASGDVSYLNDALLIATAIWDEEVDPLSKTLLSGNTPVFKTNRVLNSSYFSPIALKLFAKVDPNHAWTEVLNSEYALLSTMSANGGGVLPDWFDVNGNPANPKTTSYADSTYWKMDLEGVRVPWRLAWDYYWTQDERAAGILNKMNAFISTQAGGDPTKIPAKKFSYYNGTANYGSFPDGSMPTVASHFVGAWCMTGIAGGTAWLNSCANYFNTSFPAPTTASYSYYSHILTTMYSQLLNGLFVKPALLGM